MLLTLKVIALAAIWIGGTAAVIVAAAGVLSFVAAAAPAVAACIVTVVLVAGVFLGIGKAASSKL